MVEVECAPAAVACSGEDCLTDSGSIGGQPMERRDLEALAAARGLRPVASVTKKDQSDQRA